MAGVTKVTDLHGFADQLLLHSGLPPTVALAVAAFLPWLELTCAACLLAGYAVREAAALLAFLVIIFLAYGLWQGNEAECGCFLFPRFQKHPLGWWPLLRNLLLLGCALRTAWR